MIEQKVAGPAVKLKQVNFHTGKQALLKDLNITFDAGQWYGIIGPNGGGKSTLIKTILGLNKHTGNIRIVWPESGSGQGQIGYIPQLIPFDDSLPISVRDYLLMSLSRKPIWFRRTLPKEVRAVLAHIGLKDKLERKVGDLSGGERQRLMLSCALLQKPSLLILDEPMTGLDAKGKQEALALLKQFRKAGGTLLMIEHDWQLIQDNCDKVVWVDQSTREIDINQLKTSSYNIPSTNDTHLTPDAELNNA